MTAALTAEGLHTYYGKSHILHGVSLEAAEGQSHGAARPQRRRQDDDAAQPDGIDAAARRQGDDLRTRDHRLAAVPRRRARRWLCPRRAQVFPNLTVEENLKVPLERPGPWTPDSVYRLFPRLKERRMNRGRQLSGGEQEMLSIARALLINPKLLILDEPSQGLAPLIVREVFRIVAQMRAEGITVLLVEQNVRIESGNRRPCLCAR